MENLEEKWDELGGIVSDFFGTEGRPSPEDLLFIVGLETLGKVGTDFGRERKMEILHLGVCTVLDDYYRLEGRDADGWPRFTLAAPLPDMNGSGQDLFLKMAIIRYFGKKDSR